MYCIYFTVYAFIFTVLAIQPSVQKRILFNHSTTFRNGIAQNLTGCEEKRKNKVNTPMFKVKCLSSVKTRYRSEWEQAKTEEAPYRTDYQQGWYNCFHAGLSRFAVPGMEHFWSGISFIIWDPSTSCHRNVEHRISPW